jgi:hypothetical protein
MIAGRLRNAFTVLAVSLFLLFQPNSYAAGLYNLGAFWRSQSTSSLGWTWISGASTAGQAVGNYGTQGTGSTANFPAARQFEAYWVDGSGDFWLFGGGYWPGPEYNDLWMFNPTNSQWTWVSGSSTSEGTAHYGTKGKAAAANHPGARMFTNSWTDAYGNFWLFGGYNTASDLEYNDLWEFSPSTSEWAWVSGASTAGQTAHYGTLGVAASANHPGARDGCATWADSSGNLWLFGGYDITNSDLSDVWMYSPSTSLWTWVSGASTESSVGAYGTKGVGSTSNSPSARVNSTFWTDSSGNFWLFGGLYFENPTDYNDLWKFNPSNSQWTWVSGASTDGQAGIYGVKGTPSSSNIPGARSGSAAWTDSSGNFWLFGGEDDDPSTRDYNDLWKFTPSTTQWTWVGGASTADQAGTYGTKGVASTSNIPGARGVYNPSWSDSWGNFWLFGGFNAVGSTYFNDIWEYLVSNTSNLIGTGNSYEELVNLTTEGATDWIHWGDALTPNRKSTGGSVISNLSYAQIGIQYPEDSRTYTWTDGNSPTSGSDTNGIYVGAGVGSGYSFTVPADTNVRTLTFYSAVYNGVGTLTATLSDGSAAPYTYTVTTEQDYQHFAITYSAASAGQTLTVTLMLTTDDGDGNVGAAAATLVTTGGTGSGSLSGSETDDESGSTINLTTLGTSDWAHWGDNCTSIAKSTGGGQISALQRVGSAPLQDDFYSNDPRAMSWGDGTPTTSSSANENGFYVSCEGLSFTVPATTSYKTLVVHVGGDAAAGTFTAHLSDGSAPDYVDAQPLNSNQFDRNYTLHYKANSAGTLSLSWMLTQGQWSGNLTISGAALK